MNSRPLPLLPLIKEFIKASKSRKRIQKSGKVISNSTIRDYELFYALLERFSEDKELELRIVPLTGKNARIFKKFRGFLAD